MLHLHSYGVSTVTRAIHHVRAQIRVLQAQDSSDRCSPPGHHLCRRWRAPASPRTAEGWRGAGTSSAEPHGLPGSPQAPPPACAAPRAPGPRAILTTPGGSSVDWPQCAQQERFPKTTGAEWNITGGLALSSCRHPPRYPSYLPTPWKCESEMEAKSEICSDWRWVGWRGEAQGTWCSQAPAGLRERPSAVRRLLNGGFPACTNSPSFASCRLRTAGSQPHQTRA